ncbi:MAG: C25 family cysteine peptidase [Candidatus Delongbacteria bacterium]
MLRVLLLFLASLPALANSMSADLVLAHPQPLSNGMVLTLDFPEPDLLDVSGGQQARLAGEGLWGVAGCPDLPAVIRHIRIPDRSGVTLDVQEARWTSLGRVDMAPVQERLHTPQDLPLAWIRDEAVYQTASPWPQDWIRLSDPKLLREIRLVTLTVAPLRWNPVSGELQRLESLTVMLGFTGHNELNMPLRDEDEGLSDDSEGLVYRYHAAEDQFVRQMLGHNLLDPVSGESWQEEGSLNEIGWSAPALPLNYLVICRNAAVNQAGFQLWLEWKRRKGHHVTILTETQIPSFNASNIRAAIVSEYNTSAFPPHYVMLVGDPTDGSYTLPTHPSQYDHYYAACIGSDILADVVVGRVSVTSATMLNNVFNKIVGYETAPYLENTSWLRRASFLTGSGHCGESMSQLARDIGFQLLQERGYSQVDTAFCASSPSYVYNWFNQGISHYNYRGWIGMEGLDTNTLLNLQQGPRTPIAVVFTCSSGEFSQSESWGPAYSEAFLRGGTITTPGGAAAAMGFCTSNTHTAYNNLVDGGFWSALLDYRIPQVGTCMFRGKLELFNTLPDNDSNVNNFSYWANLMGDPGMEQWCGVPEVLHFETLPAGGSTSAQVLELRVLNAENAPVEGVAVTAWQSGDLAVSELSDAEGRVQLSLPGYPEGELKLTASKAFHAPTLAALTLSSLPATPVLQAFQVVDASGDGLLVPGESFQLQLTLANASASEALPALALSVELVDEEAALIVDGAADLAALEALGVGEVRDQLQLTLDDSWTEGLPLELNLRLGAGEQQFLLRAVLPVSTPVLAIRSASWATSALYPGETKDWVLRVENTGTITSHNLQLVPMFGSELLTVTPETLTLDSLAVGESVNVTLAVTAAANLVPGFTAPFYLLWGDASLECDGLVTTALTLGNRLVTDPTGPDAHGYYAFESTDTQWIQSPVFNWIEIAPNNGGTGTVLNLHDTADEADDSRRVQLPFPFSVYGETYSSLAVCSNGFVAFGTLAHLQTDFRNHFLPCGMGPEPMLAPMWDDFKLTSDAQVVTQYVESQHVFVIEWYRMRTNSNNAINTFQLLLYDPAVYPTPTGDGEFVYQYQTFTDTQNNDQDFPYCTVGLKNQDATIGLTLLNYHERPSTAATFGTGKAIRFSTSIGLSVDPAQLDLSATEAAFHLSETSVEAASDSLWLGNNGQAPLIWRASVLAPETWPPAIADSTQRESGGPDSFGYTWRDSADEQGPPAGWVDMWEAGSELVLTDDDDWSDPLTLPFAFPFYGEPRTQLWAHANGFVAFTEPDGNFWQNNVSLPGSSAPDQSLMIWWDDLMNNGNYSGYIRSWTNDADSVVVTWNVVPHFNQTSYGGPFTFQVVLESNGRITYNYGEMNAEDTDSDSGTIAVQLDQDTGFVIHQMTRAQDHLSIQILPPFWLTLGTSTGAVSTGELQALVLNARNDLQGLVLPAGQYTATVDLRTNDPEHPMTLIPVTLNVADVDLEPGQGPRSFALGEAVPNPFNPVTHFSFQLPEAARVQANLYNVAGQYVGTVLSQSLPAGSHSLRVDGSRLASGVYLLKLEAGPHSAVRKLTLLK